MCVCVCEITFNEINYFCASASTWMSPSSSLSRCHSQWAGRRRRRRRLNILAMPTPSHRHFTPLKWHLSNLLDWNVFARIKALLCKFHTHKHTDCPQQQPHSSILNWSDCMYEVLYAATCSLLHNNCIFVTRAHATRHTHTHTVYVEINECLIFCQCCAASNW